MVVSILSALCILSLCCSIYFLNVRLNLKVGSIWLGTAFVFLAIMIITNKGLS